MSQMSGLVTARGSIDQHVGQTRNLVLPTRLAGALDADPNRFYCGVAGIGVRLYCKLTAVVLTTGITTGAALGGGVRLCTFPDAMVPVASRITGTISLSAATATKASGEIGIGTTIASGAIATIGAGSAAMENIHEGAAQGAFVAATPRVIDIVDELRPAAGTLAAANDIFLNAANSATGTATSDLLFTGEVSVWLLPVAHLPRG